MNGSESAIPFSFWSKWLVLATLIVVLSYFLLHPTPVELLKTNWIYILVGFFGAVIGNISAVGGGLIFIPVMIFIFRLPPVTALKISLASQMFGMSSGAIGWMQRKSFPVKALVKTVPGLLLGSLFGSLVVHPSGLLIKLLFGPVSIGLGILTIWTLKKNRQNHKIEDVLKQATWPLFAVSLMGGVVTSWIAIGEGELVAAVLMLYYGCEASTCIGLGVGLLAINSTFLVAIHSFFLGGIPWSIAGFTAFGCVYGARLAPYLSRWIQSQKLKLIFAVIALADGALFIFQYFSQ